MNIHKMVCDITTAYVQRSAVSPTDLVLLVKALYAAIDKVDAALEEPKGASMGKMMGDALTASGGALGPIGEKLKDAAVKAQVKKPVQGHGISVPGWPDPVRKQKPAVSVNQSITHDYIICLEDGKKCKMMKRHLKSLGMTPDDYRLKWGLPHNYPMVSQAFIEKRRAIALGTGLGTHHGRNRELATVTPDPAQKTP